MDTATGTARLKNCLIQACMPPRPLPPPHPPPAHLHKQCTAYVMVAFRPPARILAKGSNALFAFFFFSPFFFNITFYICIVPMGFLPRKIRVAFPGESQLRQSRARKPTAPAGCFSVSKIHRTLTWTTGSLTCAQMLMHAIAHGGVPTL